MKKVSRLFAMTLALTMATNSFACTEDGQEGIVAENDMYIAPGAKNAGGISEEAFNAIIDKAEAHYGSIIQAAGGELSIKRNWTDGTVNAFASRSGRNWVVQMFGGLARHETITEDGFALVVCHEIGHHIGGAPKKGGSGGWWSGGSSWASNEGQSDYFATLKCLRQLFVNDNNAAILRSMTIPAALNDACDKSFTAQGDRELCVRGAMAGMSVAKLFQALRNATVLPDFTTPDVKVVTRTNDSHPDYQCRLDTYFQGAQCAMDDATEVSQTDEKVGTCHPANNDTVGNRPLCWFKPTL